MKQRLKKITALLCAVALCLPLAAIFAQAAPAVYLCDVSMDGTIGAEDARLALRMSVGLEQYTVAHQKAADADGDGVVLPADARLILRVSVGLERIDIHVLELKDEDFGTYVHPGTEQQPDPHKTLTDEDFPLPSVPMPTASQESGTFTITSYGWGDGVGMSQYGAAGMARNGYTYDQILQYYFTGVKIVTASSWPEYSNYLGTYYDTEELIARMVYMEIYGIVDDNPPGGEEALKAQAVTLFTLLKYHGFETYSRYQIGVITGKSYESLPAVLKNAVKSVMGQYLAVSSDNSNKPIEALFFATAALRTASAKDVWGSDYSYLQAVNSPYDLTGYNFSTTFTVSKERMRELILNYDSAIRLSSDPSEWVKILAHSASIDENRGYVTKIQVGDRVMDGYSFCNKVIPDYFWSSSKMGGSTAFYITYTP